MNKKSSKESGFATIIVMMLTVALFILLSFALKTMYSVHKQNQKDKKNIIKKVEQLNRKKHSVTNDSVKSFEVPL